jgi:hypothetical protein
MKVGKSIGEDIDHVESVLKNMEVVLKNVMKMNIHLQQRVKIDMAN